MSALPRVGHLQLLAKPNGVEVAPIPDAVLVRDSKHRTGPVLTVPTPAWHAFLTTLTR